MTPVKAIRAKCLDCCCNNAAEVRMCPSENCPLYPFRMGRNPNYKKDGETPTAETETAESEGIPYDADEERNE